MLMAADGHSKCDAKRRICRLSRAMQATLHPQRATKSISPVAAASRGRFERAP
jgi:hypothetical protein